MSDEEGLREELNRQMEMVKNLPPVPRIIAVHSVPYNKMYFQWDTNGDLWIWANRGFITDMPKGKTSSSIFAHLPSFGIPVYYEHPYWMNHVK